MIARYVPVTCFWLCLFVAIGLAALVWRAPLMVANAESPSLSLRLYASDTTLRRVTLAAATGLLATAAVFFRWRPLRFGEVRRPDGSRPEAADAAGA